MNRAELDEAMYGLMARGYWVEGPLAGGEQRLYRTVLEPGEVIGRKELVKVLEARLPAEAMVEAWELIKG